MTNNIDLQYSIHIYQYTDINLEKLLNPTTNSMNNKYKKSEPDQKQPTPEYE